MNHLTEFTTDKIGLKPIAPMKLEHKTSTIIGMYIFNRTYLRRILCMMFPKSFLPIPVNDEEFVKGNICMIYDSNLDCFQIVELIDVPDGNDFARYKNITQEDFRTCEGGGAPRSYFFVQNKRFLRFKKSLMNRIIDSWKFRD